jgi:hypothetical protein
VAGYATASSSLALLSDRRLARLVESATVVGSGIGGASAVVDLEGVRVFVKRVPLTDLERRPENIRSTANCFGLPGFYQYGVGSAGFGAWRELAAHTMASNWVLAGENDGFPLMYHWRVLPGTPSTSGGFGWFGDVERVVQYWEGSPAIRERVEAIRGSSASLVLFLEYLPHTLEDWLDDQYLSEYVSVERMLANGVAFMRSRGLLHMDTSFGNILTDGRRLYFSDFGLALTSRFELSTAELSFLRHHVDYDRAYSTMHLVNHLAERMRGDMDRREFLRLWAAGDEPGDLPATVASVLARHAPAALIMGDFDRSLRHGNKQTPYPAAEIDRCWDA